MFIDCSFQLTMHLQTGGLGPCMCLKRGRVCVSRENMQNLDVQSGVFFLPGIEALPGAAVIEGASVVGVDGP